MRESEMNHLRILKRMAIFLALAIAVFALVAYGLMVWAEAETSKVDDYRIMIRLTSEPVVEVNR
jgi:hypothetical protein